MYGDIPDDLRQLIEPIVADHGLELLDVEVQRSARPRRLRITVDQPSGDGRVTVDACALLSREIETHLDASGFMDDGGRAEHGGRAIRGPRAARDKDKDREREEEGGGAYHLEVSSPGLDRALTREKDFDREVGSEVRLSTRRAIAGRRRFRGRLAAFDGETATVVVDGEPYGVPFGEIERANRVYEFSAADFRRGNETKGGGGPPRRRRKRGH